MNLKIVFFFILQFLTIAFIYSSICCIFSYKKSYGVLLIIIFFKEHLL